MPSEGFINIQARAFSDSAQDEPLRFAAPALEGVPKHVAEFWWHQLEYAFPFSDPRTFPAIGRGAFEPRHLDVLDRFLGAASELGTSIVLNGEWKLTIDIADDDSESVSAAFPAVENLRGFSVLFRQFYSDSEIASFDAGRKVLGEVIAAADGPSRADQLEVLKTWKKAHNQLKAQQLEMWVLRALVANGKAPTGALELHRQIPNQIISLYNYGELIHFGDQREKLGELIGAGEFESSWSKMEFLIAVAGLSHFYIGFAVLVAAALADT